MKLNKSKIYFRADGNQKTGLGHIIRSLSLAQILYEEFECFFLLRNFVKELESQIAPFCRIIYLKNDIGYLEEASFIANKYLGESTIIVLDGYNFDTAYQSGLKKAGCKIVCIDDIHAYHFVADCVINHSISAKIHEYSAELYTKIYLGSDYALLRSSFREYAANRHKNQYENNKRVFISLGGADPNNDIKKILKEIRVNVAYSHFEYHIVLGPAYIGFEELVCFHEDQKDRLFFYRNLFEKDFFELMLSCSIAITSPSSVAFEFMSIGGVLYLYCIADNQKEFYNEMLKKKYAFSFNSFCNHTIADAEKMYGDHCMLIDGEQEKRYLSLFKSL